MSIRLLLDMNLSPEWIAVLTQSGYDAIHWSTIGNPRAPDGAIMDWARANGYVVLTHDLDFATLLALTHADGPSVLQVRGRNILPDHLGPIVMAALVKFESALLAGAIVVVEESKSRVRVLPL